MFISLCHRPPLVVFENNCCLMEEDDARFAPFNKKPKGNMLFESSETFPKWLNIDNMKAWLTFWTRRLPSKSLNNSLSFSLEVNPDNYNIILKGYRPCRRPRQWVVDIFLESWHEGTLAGTLWLISRMLCRALANAMIILTNSKSMAGMISFHSSKMRRWFFTYCWWNKSCTSG